jgi:hypothetical protein
MNISRGVQRLSKSTPQSTSIYTYTVYKLDGAATGDTSGADAAKPTYVLARSNEFGYANYEVVEAPIFLGTEITDAVVPQ